MVAYLARDDMNRVLDLLFEDALADPGEADELCGRT